MFYRMIWNFSFKSWLFHQSSEEFAIKVPVKRIRSVNPFGTDKHWKFSSLFTVGAHFFLQHEYSFPSEFLSVAFIYYVQISVHVGFCVAAERGTEHWTLHTHTHTAQLDTNSCHVVFCHIMVLSKSQSYKNTGQKSANLSLL